MQIDVADLQCDILSATGRKFLRAPRGTGFLYVRKSMIEQLEPVMLDLHAAQWVDTDRYEIRKDARRFENWESGVAARIGLGVAARYALGWGLQAIEERVEQLAAVLRTRLETLPDVRVRDKGARRCAIVSFSLDGASPESVEKRLRGENINVSVSEASSTLFDMKERGLSSLIRASVHYYNTEDEIDRLIQALKR